MKTGETTISNFSIDHILNRAGQNTCTSIRNAPFQSRECLQREVSFDFPRCHTTLQTGSFQQCTLQWLNCTRYQPPRLPRGQKKEGIKRQPGRHPRIPFTPVQIEILEYSYKKSPYLNSDEILRLSRKLELSDTRIKIWFQNRRAREKREKTGNSESQRSDDDVYTPHLPKTHKEGDND